MAHDPRVFVGPGQEPGGTGHHLHSYSANSPALPGILASLSAYGMRELTAAEYTAWDGLSPTAKTFRDVEKNGR